MSTLLLLLARSRGLPTPHSQRGSRYLVAHRYLVELAHYLLPDSSQTFHRTVGDPRGRIQLVEIQNRHCDVFPQVLIAPYGEVQIFFVEVVVGLYVFKFIAEDGVLLELSVAVLDRRDSVEVVAAGIAAFESVGVSGLQVSVEHHPPRPLLRHILVLVLGVHVVLAESTVRVVKLDTVQGKQLSKELGFDLEGRRVHRIPVDKVPFLLRMGVQIHVEAQSGRSTVVFSNGLYCKDRGLPVEVRVDVESVEVLPQAIHPVVPVKHSVWVQHGYEFEHEVLSQQMSPRIVGDEELQDPIEDVTGWTLSGMHSGCDEDNFFLFKLVGSFSLSKQMRVDPLLLFFCLVIVG